MAQVRRFNPSTRGSGEATVYQAWERFARGEDDLRGVRPEIAISWHRCRDQHRVDPGLTEAPAAVAEVGHALEHDVVFAELGFRAASLAHEVSSLGGIVTITDGTGRVLAHWGDQATSEVAAQANLARWFCWSEGATGTNGMGTALLSYAPVVIRGAEHWCEAFHEWTCAGVAIRDVVTREPIAVLNISCWRGELPGTVGAWLGNTATMTQRILRRRAKDDGDELMAAFNHVKSGSNAPLAAVDPAGRVVLADDTAGVLLGIPGSTPAPEPTVRWKPELPEFIRAAKYAAQQAVRNPGWSGSTQIFTRLAHEPTSISFRPVFLTGHLVGNVVTFGVSEGDPLPRSAEDAPLRAQPHRLVATRENRMVLLPLTEVSFAQSDGNDVWLSGDQGLLRSALPGLDRLEAELTDAGFLRVHRQYVVNLSRIREVERRDKGELFLVMDDPEQTLVPVSRRNAATVRRALDI
ncbi:LytTR family transcriptional regulator DNA-binding domain-containing protein [Amycolatopsis rhabdoformis]|uniref:LytTR family transcriptional regulator DNA-binding domain-containing protein n=1 Tax=Amycolatopsis rhabdoformis TaxID=1448059 RepID=A0ABZ1IM50_9PSEU|nr:LytTR family transcriptional regulator DNA-binding domain-containing protein [Amycolatopsis rhabdoformis]WSE34540.1 LytTR family transcriptional regulator DNA-binding domain-containing protein [Amycolatopsis rhabdoformis]